MMLTYAPISVRIEKHGAGHPYPIRKSMLKSEKDVAYMRIQHFGKAVGA
jgi:hypothetical protein